ncbi:hypothetical protein [Maribellus maritimus]|uniref:hypothetical protein n=1 Tax=Maribellus maritimus TaxID=2870838 RepID=UPI001EE9E7F7|nr:hypothetical protein [Maribellus maritimus]MCG6189121.1 hypothetical protein [Maribellus maritimus]
MKIYNLACDNFKMYNPTTGEVIVDEECNDNAKSLIAYWLDDFAHFNNETLMKAWEAYEEKTNKGKIDNYFNWKRLIKFIEQYDSPDWISYHINVGGYDSYTILFVVHKEVEVEETVENKMDNAD